MPSKICLWLAVVFGPVIVWSACDFEMVPTAEVAPTTEKVAARFSDSRTKVAANRSYRASLLVRPTPTRNPFVRSLTRSAESRTQRFIRPAATREFERAIERARATRTAEIRESLRDSSRYSPAFGRTRTPVPAPTPRGTATPQPAAQMVKSIENGLVQVMNPDGESGAGFVVSPGGHVVTNSRVVEDHESIMVRIVDGTSYPGTVLTRDEGTALAVIKVPSDRNLQPVPPGDPSSVQVVDRLMAAGFPPGNEAGKRYEVASD